MATSSPHSHARPTVIPDELLSGEEPELARLADWVLGRRPVVGDRLRDLIPLAVAAAAGEDREHQRNAQLALCPACEWRRAVVAQETAATLKERVLGEVAMIQVALRWSEILRHRILELAGIAARDWARPQLATALALARAWWLLSLRVVSWSRMNREERRIWRDGGKWTIERSRRCGKIDVRLPSGELVARVPVPPLLIQTWVFWAAP